MGNFIFNNIQYLKCPYEDETNQYIKSFTVNQEKEIFDFFQEYGIVVIRNVITDEECEISQQEIWKDLQLQSCNGKHVSKNDLQTLENVDFNVRSFGFIGGGEPVFMPQAIKNRVNPNIYKAYCSATGQKQFLVALERYGFMRPTKNHPRWKTLEKWLHVDMNYGTGKTCVAGYKPTEQHQNANLENPIDWQNSYFQGILAVDDCPEETGGFCVVPGFHKQVKKWSSYNKEAIQKSSEAVDPTTIQIPLNDKMQKNVQRIPIRKGSIVIWDGRLPHANFPNNSEKPRLVQYIKYNAIGKNIKSNVQIWEEFIEEFKKSEHFNNIDLNLLQKQLYGIQKWD